MPTSLLLGTTLLAGFLIFSPAPSVHPATLETLDGEALAQADGEMQELSAPAPPAEEANDRAEEYSAEENSAPNAGGIDAVYDILAAVRARHEAQLESVRDGTPTVNENAFYLMMARTADLPELVEEKFSRLDAVAYTNLLRNPDRYRYQPLRMTVRVYEVRRLTVADRQIAPNPYWSIDREMWLINAVAQADSPGREADQPIRIFAARPPRNLPDPSSTAGEVRKFAGGPAYTVAAVFFKFIRTPDRGAEQRDPRERNYPVLLAWQFEKPTVQPPDKPWEIPALLTVLGLAAIFGFIVLKKHIRRQKSQNVGWAHRYNPLKEPREDEDEFEMEDGPVDEELKSAAEAYRREHGLDEEESS